MPSRSSGVPGFYLGLALAAGLVAAAVSPAAQSASRVDDLLQGTMGFSAGDVRAIHRGSTAIRSLETPVREELAHVGVVHIEATPERFVERFRDIVRFEKGPGIPQIGRFSPSPQLQDLSSLTLPDADVAALRTCRPGACDLKLSADAMEGVRREVDWSSPHAASQANHILRTMILDQVRAYQADGNAALGRYDDGGEPLLVANEFRALLASDDPLPTPVPALLAYLDDYPRGRPAGAEDFFYWTVVDFGLKHTIRVNRVTIQQLDARVPPGVEYVIAIQQLYASHYFHTTLELRFLVRGERQAGRTDTWLVSVTRSRTDGMTGFKGLFLRPVISRRSRDAVRGYLAHVKRQVERPAPADF